MSEQLVSDELWRMVKPLLPAETSKARGGRPRIPDRTVLSGIVFVLRSGIPWRMLPIRDGLRQRRDLLAKASRLAEGGRMASSAPSPFRSVGKERQGGLVEGELGLGERARQRGVKQ